MTSFTSAVTSDQNDPGDEQQQCEFMLKDVAARCLAKCKSGTGTLQQANSMAKTCNTLVKFIVNDIKKDVESLQMLCHKSNAFFSYSLNKLFTFYDSTNFD